MDKLYIAPETKDDIGYIIKGVEKAAVKLHFTSMPISSVSRKHIKMILEQCWKNNNWTPVRYNAYRAYLVMLFKELVQHEAVPSNPVYDIAKMKGTKKIRAVLSDAQRKQVNAYLKKADYRFWLFINMFFHSGGRLKELSQLKVADVNLVNQTYTTLVKKGREYTQVKRTIKDLALPFWREYLQLAKANDYLFGVNFFPL